MKKLYAGFCKIEVLIANLLLAGITALVLCSAIARTVGRPLNWAVDISLLLFAWEVFLGGDIATRDTGLIGVDMLMKKLPVSIQKALSIVFSIMIIAFLAVLVRYGIPLCLESTKRLFQTLTISYAWCTLSVPVGAALMMISTGIRLYHTIKTPLSEWGK